MSTNTSYKSNTDDDVIKYHALCTMSHNHDKEFLVPLYNGNNYNRSNTELIITKNPRCLLDEDIKSGSLAFHIKYENFTDIVDLVKCYEMKSECNEHLFKISKDDKNYKILMFYEKIYFRYSSKEYYNLIYRFNDLEMDYDNQKDILKFKCNVTICISKH